MSPRVGVTLSGRYRLQRLIATGGMGQVWEAVDSRLGRRVAVKVLKQEYSSDPEFVERFRAEARTVAMLNHPGIAAVHDYGETDMDGEGRTAYLVMELVNGEPLNSVIKRTGRLSLRHALDMLEQTGRALQVAHAAGLVHRDVKPGNILITPTGQVKLTDFGIAKAVDAAPVTQTGMVMGTAQYIAPEQALGEDATAASDVYSLGVVGYEAVSGKRPFTGDGALTVAMKHIKETPAPLPADLPPNVRELIEITLVKNPAMRYSAGGQFADAVSAVRSGRRPPRPNAVPTIKATPAAIPGTGPKRPPAEVRPATTARPRPTTARPTATRPSTAHRPPPPARRTFSSGQRALLWAAGVLGALAIISAILIVLADRERRSNTPVEQTITDTVSPQPAAPARPSGWSDRVPPGSDGADIATVPAVIRMTAAETTSVFAHDNEDTAMTTPHQLSDRYELGEILGFGGMSEVHIARDLRLHRDVAVKVLRADLARDPSFYLRFRREAQNAAALNHPAIVAVYDTGEAITPSGPLPYIVMEYVDGVTLRDIVHADGPMPPRRALEVIADACQALNFSHQHGIVRRDVKPANIMVSKAGAVKVMDFGIARAIADTGNPVTQTSAVIGTAQYLSPERARGERVDSRSDVYSLGCVLYEMLTGQPPFVGDTPVSVAYQHVREDPVPPSHKYGGISPELDAVVLKALAKNPDNRYQSAAEMRSDLVRVHSGEKPDAPKVLTQAERTQMMTSRPGTRADGSPAALDYDYRDTPRRSIGRWMVALAILSVLTVVVTLAINLSGGGRPREVQVPDVRGQVSAEAIAALQTKGFKIRTQQKPDNTVPADHVISTEPAGNLSVNAGDEILINVSTGTQQREVPDVAGLSYAEAVKKLTAAGFGKFKQTEAASTVAQRDKVLSTNPPANQTAALTNEITVVVGTGPVTRSIPDVTGQTAEVATKNLNTLGFPTILTAPMDSPEPAGQVLGIDPPTGTDSALDTAITLKVSKGNQFVMPNLVGQFWLDAEPNLRGLGWTGVLVKGPDVQNSGQRNNAVVTQSPAAGAGVNFDGSVTLSFAS